MSLSQNRDRIRLLIFFAVILAALGCSAEQRFAAAGMVLEVDPQRQTVTVSCEPIPNYMQAMVMPLPLHDAKILGTLKPGMNVGFTLVVTADSSYIQDVKVRPFQSLELDPTQAQRFRIIEKAMDSSPATPAIKLGQSVPDFTLTDQIGQPISLSQFAGKIVAVTFVYSRCPLPNYCFRLSSNFGQLQKRFKSAMGKDLVLLSVIIDPTHETPETLKNYARIWKADPQQWHFLTGPLPQIEQICRTFNMDFYPDEALLVHSFSTAIVDRQGKLAALLEGNDFTSQQLGDLVQTTLAARR